MVTVPKDDLAGGGAVSAAKAKVTEVLKSVGGRLAQLKVKLGELADLPDEPEDLKRFGFVDLNDRIGKRLAVTSLNIRATLPKPPDMVLDKASGRLVRPRMTPMQQDGLEARADLDQKHRARQELRKSFDGIVKDAASEIGEFIEKEEATFSAVREAALELAKSPDGYYIGMNLVLVIDNRFSLKEAFELYCSIISADQEEVRYAEKTLQISRK